MQKSFSSVLPKRVYPFFMRMHSKSTLGKLANHKKASSGNVSRGSLVTIAKKNNFKQRRNVLSSEKGLQLRAVITPPAIDHLS